MFINSTKSHGHCKLEDTLMLTLDSQIDKKKIKNKNKNQIKIHTKLRPLFASAFSNKDRPSKKCSTLLEETIKYQASYQAYKIKRQ